MMKHTLGRILGLLVLGAFAIVAPEGAQAVTSTGPYYATPSWDQKLPAATRFVVLIDWNNEAVLDRETGLVWETSPDGTLTNHRDAQDECIAKSVGNRKGWRLPFIHELASLVNTTQSLPALSPGHPFTVSINQSYWTATKLADFPSFARVVEFAFGLTPFRPKATPTSSVWCVRGGGALTEN